MGRLLLGVVLGVALGTTAVSWFYRHGGNIIVAGRVLGPDPFALVQCTGEFVTATVPDTPSAQSMLDPEDVLNDNPPSSSPSSIGALSPNAFSGGNSPGVVGDSSRGGGWTGGSSSGPSDNNRLVVVIVPHC